MRSLRTRLAVTLVALVVLTVAAIGVGVYAFVDTSLRARLVADARQQADFNLSVLLPAAVPAADRRRDASAPAACRPQFRLRGEAEVIADFGDGSPWASARLQGALDELSPELKAIVDAGELGYAWQTVAGRAGARGRRAPGRRAGRCYFVFPAAASRTTRSRSCGSACSRAGCSRSCSRWSPPGSSPAASCGR